MRAICVCKAGQSPGEQDLIEFVASRIARFKRPREVVFVPALPAHADGSWDRPTIVARYG